MAKVRIHNEWFQPIQKTTCPCGQKKTDMFAWGEYVNGKWRTMDHFCQSCFVERVQKRLIAHAGPCGCVFNLIARNGYSIPSWIQMPWRYRWKRVWKCVQYETRHQETTNLSRGVG